MAVFPLMYCSNVSIVLCIAKHMFWSKEFFLVNSPYLNPLKAHCKHPTILTAAVKGAFDNMDRHSLKRFRQIHSIIPFFIDDTVKGRET